MNIHLGLNTLNQFQSYSQPYPSTETPIIQPYDDKHTVANPVYSPVPVMVTAQVLPQVQQQPRQAQVSE